MTARSNTLVSNRGTLRDFNNALGQQLFFWGRDVIHPDGNLLCEYGFKRRKSEGVDGTSCYRMLYEGDIIELHGACVGQYSKDHPGFLYIRNRKRCFLYDSVEPPAPGIYITENLWDGPLDKLQHGSRKFLDWWLHYESWIAEVTSTNYRHNCYRTFRKLPRSKSWLPPEQALEWLRLYKSASPALVRAAVWKGETFTAN